MTPSELASRVVSNSPNVRDVLPSGGGDASNAAKILVEYLNQGLRGNIESMMGREAQESVDPEGQALAAQKRARVNRRADATLKKMQEREANEPYWEGEAEIIGPALDENLQPVDTPSSVGEFLTQRNAPPAYTDPTLNPNTGAKLKQEPIFGGAGTISEAFATPSDNATRFRNPHMVEGLSDLQKRVASAEIGAIQRVSDRSGKKQLEGLFKEWGNVQKLIDTGMLNQSQVAQLKTQFNQKARQYSAPELFEQFQALQAVDSPEVPAARLRETYYGSALKLGASEEEALTIKDLIRIKDGGVDVTDAKDMLSTLRVSYDQRQKEAAETRRTKKGRMDELEDALEKAYDDGNENYNPIRVQAYYDLLDAYKEEWDIPGEPPVRGTGDKFNYNEQLKYLKSARKTRRLPRSPDGFLEIKDKADEQAAQEEANRTGKPQRVRKLDGTVGWATPEGSEY